MLVSLKIIFMLIINLDHSLVSLSTTCNPSPVQYNQIKEDTFHNPTIKLFLLDMHECQSSKNFEIIVVCWFSTPNIHSSLKVVLTDIY